MSKSDQENIDKLIVVNQSLTEFERVSAGIAALDCRYRDVAFAVTTTSGMAEAKAARLKIREPRYAAQNAAKAAKSELAAISKTVGEKAEQIAAQLLALEEPIDAQIKAEERRKEDERLAKLHAEAKRAQVIREKITRFSAMVDDVAGRSIDEIVAVEHELIAANMLSDEALAEEYEEFDTEAKHFIEKALLRCSNLREAAQAAKDDADKLAAERAELARLRAEAEEREAAAKVAQAKVEAEAAAERQRAAAELARQQEAMAAERRKHDEELAAQRRAEEERFAVAQAEAASKWEAERAEARADIERQRVEAQRVIDAANRIAAEQRAAEEARQRTEAEARLKAEMESQAVREAEEARLAGDRAEADRIAAELLAVEQAKQDRVTKAAPQMLSALRAVRNSGLWSHATDHIKVVISDALMAAGDRE